MFNRWQLCWLILTGYITRVEYSFVGGGYRYDITVEKKAK